MTEPKLDAICYYVIGKVLLNLETKLSRLESANEKLNKVYKQSHNEEGAGQFQLMLNEEVEFIDGVFDSVTIESP